MSSDCHICAHSHLEIIPRAGDFWAVTSDCKPWAERANLAVCQRCSTIQVPVSQRWRESVASIYKEYQVYHQGGGSEQSVFSGDGNSTARSHKIISNLIQSIPIKDCGRLLDIGCGNGSFLKAFSGFFSDWQLSGAEFDEKHLTELKLLPHFDQLHVGPLEKIQTKYDLVALIHTLEHIENPSAFLASIKNLMEPEAILLIQVPYFFENPFELMTIDHVTHFAPHTLTSLLSNAGFHARLVTTDWVKKEISVVAGLEDSATHQGARQAPSPNASIEWLSETIAHATATQNRSTNFGIFGSSIAATWTATNLPEPPDFFVDEDPSRVGRTHLGKNILSPADIQNDASIFVALQPDIQYEVLRKFSGRMPGNWVGNTPLSS
jgi:trans-aconitate methyltransferase